MRVAARATRIVLDSDRVHSVEVWLVVRRPALREPAHASTGAPTEETFPPRSYALPGGRLWTLMLVLDWRGPWPSRGRVAAPLAGCSPVGCSPASESPTVRTRRRRRSTKSRR